MHGIYLSEVTRVCNEDSKKGAKEEIVAYGESRRGAIWFYAWQKNGRYSVYSEEVARGILKKIK